MIPLAYLTYVIYGCIHMSYGSSQRRPEGQAPQSCTKPITPATPPRSCRPTARKVLFHLPASGLSVPRASATVARACSGQRSESCLYRQTLAHSRAPVAEVCRQGQTHLERKRQSGADGHARSRTEAWLRSGQRALVLSIWNMVSIVCWVTSLPKPINCWYRTSSGPPAARRRLGRYKPTAIEAHWSSTRQQREERTTNTQTPALIQYAERHRYAFPLQRPFQEEGDRGIRWFRPSRRAGHDLAIAGNLPTALLSQQVQARNNRVQSGSRVQGEEWCCQQEVWHESTGCYLRACLGGSAKKGTDD